jgi:hypothetical protein
LQEIGLKIDPKIIPIILQVNSRKIPLDRKKLVNGRVTTFGSML